MEIGKKYSFKGQTYVYNGEWIEGVQKRPGLYSLNGKIKVVKKKEKPTENDLLNEILSSREASGIIKKHSLQNPIESIKEDSDEDIRKGSVGDRLSLNEVLRYTISPKDDQLVKIVKEQINLRNIKANSLDYNMVYGLRVRNTMKYETLLKWCEILGMQLKVMLV